MTDFVVLVLAGFGLLGGITLMKAAEQRRLRSQLVGYRLGFPRNLEAEGVAGALAGFSGLLLPWWRRWLAFPFLSLEVHADHRGITHYLIAPKPWARAVENVLQASVPAVRIEPVALPDIKVRQAAEYRLSSHQRSLLIEAVGISAKLLASLQPLDPETSVVVQWVLTPHGPVPPARVVSRQSQAAIPPTQSNNDADLVGAIRKKHALPLLLAAGRIGVRSASSPAALTQLRLTEAAWHETRAPGVHFGRRALPNAWVAESIRLRRAPLSAWPATLNTEELAGLVGWPVGLM
ncbi:MAG: hypothetical protein ACRDVW_01175, partial [Acidimicrobiales bacterium]